MKKLHIISALVYITFLIQVCSFAGSIEYWDKQRFGANVFNKDISPEAISEAQKHGILLLRIAPDKWSTKEKDFLIGNADNYKGLVTEDLFQLKKVLDECDNHNIKVVITMLSLPGSRWKQLNGDKNDFRLWQNKSFQKEAIRFWVDVAKELKGNKAIVAYNILNEPNPEVADGYHSYSPSLANWVRTIENTAKDLNSFYARVVEAIRKEDPNTPIILDSGLYGDPRTFSYLKPLNDKNVIYAFHMYEPYEYTNKQLNKRKTTYPGDIEMDDDKAVYVDKQMIWNTYLKPVKDWQERHNIPSNRIFAEEFGGNRMNKGIENYLRDITSIFNEQKWHWAFYSFREDEWDGMNYELGSEALGAKYWDDINKGKKPELKYDDSNPIWTVIMLAMKTDASSQADTPSNP
jgi:hypothetical protein